MNYFPTNKSYLTYNSRNYSIADADRIINIMAPIKHTRALFPLKIILFAPLFLLTLYITHSIQASWFLFLPVIWIACPNRWLACLLGPVIYYSYFVLNNYAHLSFLYYSMLFVMVPAWVSLYPSTKDNLAAALKSLFSVLFFINLPPSLVIPIETDFSLAAFKLSSSTSYILGAVFAIFLMLVLIDLALACPKRIKYKALFVFILLILIAIINYYGGSMPIIKDMRETHLLTIL